MKALTITALIVFFTTVIHSWNFKPDDVESTKCEDISCVNKLATEQSQCFDLTKFQDLNLIKSVRRNVIFVGKSGTGKSTIAKMLENPTYLTTLPTLESRTKEADLVSFSVPFNNSFVNLNIIDTPGLFDIRNNPSEKQTNEVILTTIKECMNKEVTKINKIYFVLNHDSNVNMQNFEALEIFLREFAGGKAQLRILFSRAQLYTPKVKDEIIQMYKAFESTKQLFADMKVMFAGAIDYQMADNSAMYSTMLSNVKEMRKLLLHDIFCDTDEVPISILHHDPVEAERINQELKSKKEYARSLLNKNYKTWGDDDALFLQELVHKMYPNL